MSDQIGVLEVRVNVYYHGAYGESVDAIACTAGANCSWNVDRMNSDGTGVAILKLDSNRLDYLTDMLDADEKIESYKVFE